MEKRYKDTDLREALKRKYADTPKLPADFMAKMEQTSEPSTSLPRKKGMRIWRWMAAAASLLLLIGIGVTMLPKEDKQVPVVAKKVEQKKHEEPKVVEPEPQIASPVAEKPHPQKQRKQLRQPVAADQLLAQESTPVEEVATDISAETANDVATALSTNSEMLTDSDIPITRPENYKYTPEEIALMKRQAAEAYLKWVELELEIAKYNQEQTAQK